MTVDWFIDYFNSYQTFIGHIGDGFLRSNDPTNSVKALKEHTKLI